MKTEPTNPPRDREPSTAELPAPRRLLRRAIRGVAHVVYILFHHVWSVVIIGVCLIAYLWGIGLPSTITAALIRRVGTGPFRMTIERLRIDPLHGPIADNLRLYEAGKDSNSLLRVERLGLGLDWRALMDGQPSLRELRIANGTVRWPDLDAKAKPIECGILSATVGISTGAIHLADLTLSAFGVPVEGQGVILQSAPETHRPDMWPELQAMIRHAEMTPAWVTDLGRELDEARYLASPHGRLTFKIVPDEPAKDEVSLTAEGYGTALRGEILDGWSVEARVRDEIIVISNASLRVGSQALHASATLNMPTHMIDGRLFSDAPPDHIVPLLPQSLRAILRAQGIVAHGSMKAELWAGPVDVDDLARNFSGWISVEQAELRGVPFEKAFVSFKQEGDLTTVGSLKGSVGRGSRTGPMEGSFAYDAAAREYHGYLDLRCYADDFIPVLTPPQAAFVSRFKFDDKPPSFVGSFAGATGSNDHLRLWGRLTATNFLYYGQFIASLDTTIGCTNEFLNLNPFIASRAEGSVEGSLHLDLGRGKYGFDLRSTADPDAVIKIVGPGLEHALQFLTFTGPAHARAAGVWDDAGGDDTDLRVDFEGQNAAAAWFKADTCVVSVDVKKDRYSITNLSGSAFGGSFAGTLELYPDPSQQNLRYDLDARITNANFGLLSESFRGTTNASYNGLFTCHANVTGPAADDFMKDTTGSGTVSIKDGQLFRMDLFGGISRLLSAIFPGLGVASQTDFTSGFALGNNRLTMSDAMLKGTVLSIQAAGSYSFDHKLDFKVEVKPLRGGSIAAAMRLLMLPVTKLLEFHLGGTLDEPKWRPVNLPKELFLIFD